MAATPADQTAIEAAGRLLRQGALVAFPTETVYGLGADATNGRAVAAIFETKGRPRFNPLIVHVPDLEHAEKIAVLSPSARKLAALFWPGPLTLVLKRRADAAVSDLVSAGLDTIAIRVPGHPVAQALLAAAERPLAAPSANRSGRVSPTTAQHVLEDFEGRLGMVLDGGSTPHGLESTVLDASGDETVVLLRPGAVPREEIEAVLGRPLGEGPASDDVHPTSPGQLASHYAPEAAMRLDATEVRPGEALLAFGAEVPTTDGPSLNLSPRGDLVEAAAGLFASLRALDRTGAKTIAVMPIPEHGLGEAINDRLRRAAAPRT
ncbi:L-threonylcarbamoyladenylate synthase [Hyphomicrobium sp.]|uniref:L-threonylcarbamoyladenylate synthase n=1 Tax=Hyphomicrobium sp. TaxID=82 RepID=UPI002E371AFF|nr:L-threonylcarbamoyladenylate synthase [Hyphomicrobium sp.]HEX2840000.1 L-threonylcarbamoyladenylate synthase [Hyphomicrobium sp.]